MHAQDKEHTQSWKTDTSQLLMLCAFTHASWWSLPLMLCPAPYTVQGRHIVNYWSLLAPKEIDMNCTKRAMLSNVWNTHLEVEERQETELGQR